MIQPMQLGVQIIWLFILAIPIACIVWTLTHEEIFREAREYCVNQSRTCEQWYRRKFFYIFTCEYCFSHYVTIFFVAITRYQLLMEGWRGYLSAIFALVWISNFYLTILGRLRLEIKDERVEIAVHEKELEQEQRKTS